MKPTLLAIFGALLIAGGVAAIYAPAGVIVAGMFALGGATIATLAEVHAERARANTTNDTTNAQELTSAAGDHAAAPPTE